MWYAVISEDVDNSLELRRKSRDAHLSRLQALVADGRVLIAGPHPAIDADDIIVDAIFGIGLNRPADDWVMAIFQYFRASKAFTLSIDNTVQMTWVSKL